MINSKKRILIKSKQTNLRTKNRRNTKRSSKKSNRKYIKKNTHKKGGMELVEHSTREASGLSPITEDMELDEPPTREASSLSPTTNIKFAPVTFKSQRREKSFEWMENDYLLVAHGGVINGQFMLNESINYILYCSPGSRLESVNQSSYEQLTLLEKNMIQPHYKDEIREGKLQVLNNYTLEPDKERGFKAGLFDMSNNKCIMK